MSMDEVAEAADQQGARLVDAGGVDRARPCSGSGAHRPTRSRATRSGSCTSTCPAAWVAYLAFGVTSIGSALWLWPRTRATVWDRVAGASAELGVIFTALTLVLGSLWGRPVWGVWWAWDARLVTTAVLFFLYLGYLALRRIPAPPEARAKRCAIAALIAFVDVPIVHFSVNWWRTLHQEGTVFNERLDAKIHGVMAFTLWFGVLAFTLLFVYLLDRRYRLLALEEDREDREVQQAIAERVERGR